MLDKLKQVEDRYEELCARAEQPDFYADPKKAAAWLRDRRSWLRSSQPTAPTARRSGICRMPRSS